MSCELEINHILRELYHETFSKECIRNKLCQLGPKDCSHSSRDDRRIARLCNCCRNAEGRHRASEEAVGHRMFYCGSMESVSH